MSLLTGEYPDLLKLVKVIPIHKVVQPKMLIIIDRSLYYPYLIKLLKIFLMHKRHILLLRKTIYYFVTNLDSEKTIQLSMLCHNHRDYKSIY